MHASVLVIDLHLPLVDSLKAKRASITPILEGARRRHKVAVSEVGHQDEWRRSELAFATVASSETQAREVLDAVERFVWSFPEVEVVSAGRSWLDEEEAR
ncbi:MAG: hypothetical protein JWM89_2812 [Acidimicrobiales bacterium]|nr:hypothetical protein [Acidimicrobiales bacterium]